MTRTNKVRAAVAVLAVSTLILGGCAAGGDGGNGAGGESKGALAMSFAGLDIQIWNDMLPIMEEKVEGAGYAFLSDNPEWNPQTQVSDWESWIVQGNVKAIMGYPAQADALIPVTAQAAEAGIPVVGYGSTWDGVTASVGFNHKDDGYTLGKDIAAWIVENGLDDGKVIDVALLGTDAVDLGRLRHEGIQEALDDAELNVKITQYADAISVDGGYKAVQTQLNAFPNTKVWIGLSNDPALGAYQALLDSGVNPKDKSILLANIDATDAELNIFMEDTFWQILYTVPARTVAEANAQLLIDAAEGKDLKDVTLSFTKVTQDNAGSFLLANQK